MECVVGLIRWAVRVVVVAIVGVVISLIVHALLCDLWDALKGSGGGDVWAAGVIPEGYYDAACQKPEGVDVVRWLAELEWVGPVDLSGGGWDCSAMAARIEYLAENCGVDAQIVCRSSSGLARGHCWAVVDGLAYEATGNYWVNLETADVGYYDSDVVFDNIYGALEYGGLDEWGWWLMHPELGKGVGPACLAAQAGVGSRGRR